MQTKVCGACHEELPTASFRRGGEKHKDGFQSRCKACTIARRESRPLYVGFPEALPGEEWREAPPFQGLYAVSSLGRFAGTVRYPRRRYGARKASTTSTGHKRVVMTSLQGDKCVEWLHRVVLEVFVGPRPDGAITRHLNGDPGDNRVCNLAWGSPRENMHDKWKHDTMYRGSAHHSTSLTEGVVQDIRRALRQGCSRRDVEASFGVGYGVVKNIDTGKTWRSLPWPDGLGPKSVIARRKPMSREDRERLLLGDLSQATLSEASRILGCSQHAIRMARRPKEPVVPTTHNPDE